MATSAIVFLSITGAIFAWGIWMAWKGIIAEFPGFREGAKNSGVQPRDKESAA